MSLGTLAMAFLSGDAPPLDGEAQAEFEAAAAQFRKAENLGELNAAAALIERISERGYAPATERCALIECVGAGRPINWSKALDRLQQAAEQGSPSAARQLMIFSEIDEDLADVEAVGDASWTDVRRRIDLPRMLGRRQGQVALQRPYVAVIQKFASPAECRWLVDSARGRLGPSTVFDYSSGALRGDERRTNSAAMFAFESSDLVLEMIRARIAATLELELPRFEVSQVLHYAPGQEFKPHHDYFDPAAAGFQQEIASRGQRIATFLIYLNDEFTGGETRFPELGFNYRGEIGDAITFANVDPGGGPNPRTLHAGLPPTSGEKWIFSQWVRDRPAGISAPPEKH